MAPEHCFIKFYRHGYYYGISDLSNNYANSAYAQRNASSEDPAESGTWVSVMTNIISDGDWYNLHEAENSSRQFCILQTGIKPVYFSVRKLP